MAGENGIGDHRFEGFSNQQLATEIDLLGQGPGGESMHRAVEALKAVATSLADTDRTMREELSKIGVEWESQAAEDATVQMTDSAGYGGSAHDSINTSGQAVSSQGDSYTSTRNGAPASSALRGAAELTGMDKLAGSMLGHTTDHAKEVQQTNAARQHAVDVMNGYTSASQANLAGYSSLPVPPGMALDARPASGPGVTSAAGFGLGAGDGLLQTSGTSGGSSSLPAGPGGGGGGSPATPPFGGGQGGGQGGTGGPNPPGAPGKLIGGGPMSTPTPVSGGVQGGLPGGMPPRFGGLGDAAALSGMAGVAGNGATAGAERDRLVRGRGGPGGPGRSGMSASRGAMLGGVPADEAAAARTAERIGSSSKPGSSMMQPAAAGTTSRDEEDETHVRKYGVEADDVFGDDRLVIPSVLGEDDEADEEK